MENSDDFQAVNEFARAGSFWRNQVYHLIIENNGKFKTRGPFLESPGNFSGPKSNIQI